MPSTYYETPNFFFKKCAEAYGPFDLDAAANQENKKCENYLSESDNALDWNKSWDDWDGQFANWTAPPQKKVWLNPPWGPSDPIFPWVRKAVKEIQALNSISVICLLLPWGRWAKWHEFIIPQAEMVRVVGRLPFLLAGKSIKSPPACNVVAILRAPIDGMRWPTGFAGATIDVKYPVLMRRKRTL